MTKKDLLSYWLETATDALETAEALYKLKKYHHSLFFCHLALEKLLKGLVFKRTNSHAPPILDLLKLAQSANLKVTKTQEKELAEMTTWNIRARYDSVKREFYKKATAEFTKIWVTKTKELFTWIKSQY